MDMKDKPVSRQELEVIYIRCYHAALDCDMNTCKLYYDIIQSFYKDSRNKETFKQVMTPVMIKELKKITQSIDKGVFIEEFQPIDERERIEPLSKTEVEEEMVLNKKLALEPKLLESVLGEGLELKHMQHQINKDKETCDLVLQQGKKIYPIGIKLKQANHAVVGQIDKYCRHYKKKTVLKFYNEVQGVVLANSYSKYAINELRRRNFICITYSGDINNLKFGKVT